MLTSVCATAQYNVSGRVQTHSDGMPVEMATIRLFSYADSDSTLVQGAQTDDQGRFLLTHIPAGFYKLYVSNVGFREQQQAVTLRDSDVELRPIRLHEEVQALAEVQVQGHAAEMTVKGDTIEYNTAAYKVSENAMVEDLLKKMNGVTVDKEGNVTVNGESITSVRIDGKKFFGKDVQSATKNIPADMIEKVQVIDEKSDMAKLTGFDDDEGEHIINLTLKKKSSAVCLASTQALWELTWLLRTDAGSTTRTRHMEPHLRRAQSISLRTISATTRTSLPISCWATPKPPSSAARTTPTKCLWAAVGGRSAAHPIPASLGRSL